MRSPTTGQPFAIMTPSGPRWTGKVELIEHMLDVPLRRKAPTTYFVNSMADLFHEDLPDADIDRIFAVMALCPQHTFQVLTKRAERMREYVSSRRDWVGNLVTSRESQEIADWAERVMPLYGSYGNWWPLPNVWLGVSVEDQQRADERIPLLLKTPAAVRFLSLEPLLEDLGDLKLCDCSRLLEYGTCGRPHIDWVIVGGESGPGARMLDIAWVRSIVVQCMAAGTACFVKQLGSFPCKELELGTMPLRLRDSKGGDMQEWPEWLRVRQMPNRNDPTQKEQA